MTTKAPRPKPTAVIFDVDGTLVDVSSVRHHVILNSEGNPGYKDFKAFHEGASGCPPIVKTLLGVQDAINAGHEIIVVTARAEEWRTPTRWWLQNHGIYPRHQLHRQAGDHRVDREVKKDILDGLRQHYNIVHAWDDNPSIIQLWKDEGIPVTEVPGWEYEKVAA